ncbi:hypothetical protein OIU76_023175 [Salix suchowensis]|nr:hypothetical protein OIU76_023175 [Salix suchowensis]
MLEKGITPGVVTYNAILRGLFKLQLTNEAMAVFDEMISDGVAAGSQTYSIIVEGLCESGQIDGAKKFWDEVIWPSKIHDDFVYAAILKGLCRSCHLNEAIHFLYELVDSGVNPNIVSYNIVIDRACSLGMKREAYQIVGEMQKNGLNPDAWVRRASCRGIDSTSVYVKHILQIVKERKTNLVKNGFPAYSRPMERNGKLKSLMPPKLVKRYDSSEILRSPSVCKEEHSVETPNFICQEK